MCVVDVVGGHGGRSGFVFNFQISLVFALPLCSTGRSGLVLSPSRVLQAVTLLILLQQPVLLQLFFIAPKSVVVLYQQTPSLPFHMLLSFTSLLIRIQEKYENVYI